MVSLIEYFHLLAIAVLIGKVVFLSFVVEINPTIAVAVPNE